MVYKQRKVLEAATSTGAGEAVNVLPEGHIGILTTANNLDPENDELEIGLDVRLDGTWGAATFPTIYSNGEEPPVLQDNVAFQERNGSYSAFIRIKNLTAKRVKPHILTFNDDSNNDLSVDVMISTNALNTKVEAVDG